MKLDRNRINAIKLLGYLLITAILCAGGLAVVVMSASDWSLAFYEADEAIWFSLAFVFPLTCAQLMLRIKTRFHELTMILGFLVLLLAGLSLGAKRDFWFPDDWFPDQSAFMFIFAAGGLLSCLVVFGTALRVQTVRRENRTSDSGNSPLESPPSKERKKQFGLRMLMVWTALVAMIAALIFSNPYFPFALDDLHGADLLITLAFFLPASILFLTVQAWLNRAKPFSMAILTLFVLATFGSLLLTCLISMSGLVEGEDSQYLTSILIVVVVVGTVVAWTVAIRMSDGWNSCEIPVESVQQTRLGRLSTLSKRICFAVAIAVCAMVGYSAVFHHWTFFAGQSRDVERLRDSKIARSYLESAYSDGEKYSRIFRENEGKDFVGLLNALNSDGVQPQENLLYRLAKISTMEFFNDPEYLFRLGLTDHEIAKIGNHDLGLWLKGNRPYIEPLDGEDWNDTSKTKAERLRIFNEQANPQAIEFAMIFGPPPRSDETPWATKYCQSKQDIFKLIREAADSDSMFDPLDSSGFGRSDFLLAFARDMLTIDSNFQIGQGNLDRAIENCEAMTNIASLMQQEFYDSLSLSYQKRMRSWALTIGWQIVSSPSCTKAQMLRLEDVFSHQTKFLELTEGNIAQTAVLGLHRLGFDREHPDQFLRFELSDSLVGEYVKAFPSVVDWKEFIQAYFESTQSFVDLLHKTDRFTRDYQSTVSQIKLADSNHERNIQFHHSILAIFRGPKFKARRLEKQRNVFSDFSFPPSTMFFKLQTRLILDELALELELHRKSKGTYPDSLTQLRPRFMTAVPMDPFTDKPFLYRKLKDQFVLYSTGPDQTNDGGTQENEDYIWMRPPSSLLEYMEDN